MPKLSEVGNRRVKLSEIQEPEQHDPNEGMSRLDHLLVGAGRGFTELWQGGRQASMHLGGMIGTQDAEDVAAYDRKISDESERYERNLGDSGWASAGRIGGQIAATAPLGAIGAGARGVPLLLRAGAAQGAAASALAPVVNVRQTPTLSDLITGGNNPQGVDYLDEKVKQTALGAATGAVFNAGGSKLMDLVMGTANAPRRAANALLAPQATPGPATVSQRIITGSPAAIRKGDAVAASTGINLTPGQRSGGKAITMAENVARGSIWTRDQMFAGDQQRARQMINAINRAARSASPDEVSAEGFAKGLQGKVSEMTHDLAKSRSEFGRQAYGAVEKAAGGEKVVRTSATLDEIASIVDEFGSVQGADASAVARQAEAFFNKLSGDGAISPGLAMRQMQAWEQAARTGQGLFEGVQDRTTAKVLARRLSQALMKDLDDTANAAGGSVGESLKAANKGWRDYSQKIDALESSALGRIVGEDFVDDVAGVAFNKVPPEKVWQRLDSLTPSELNTVKSYLSSKAPEMWGQYQRIVLERARDAAKTAAPSMGARPLGINPAAFVRQLEGSSGKRAINEQKRLQVIFGGTPLEGQVRQLTEAGRRLADFTGYNSSGTAGASEVMGLPGLLGKVAQGAQGAAGALGPLFGLRGVASAASKPINQRAIPMLQRPALPATVGSALLPGASSQVPSWLLQPPARERKK